MSRWNVFLIPLGALSAANVDVGQEHIVFASDFSHVRHHYCFFCWPLRRTARLNGSKAVG